MSLSLRYAARTDVGLARDGNEDALYAGPRLLAVADGMGGHAAGEVASRVVIETLARLDSAPPDGDVATALENAVETANGYLRDMVAADGALEGMGTTLTAFLWADGQLALVHIGDSRAYALRGGQLQQVTHDHTFVQSLIDQGRITPDEATTHPQRSWITNALDGRRDIHLDLSMHDVRVGDRYLVCSDGLSSYVSEATIAETLADGDPQTACDQLVDLALRAGGLDNISCIVAEVVEEDRSGENAIVGGAAADPGPPATPTRDDSPAARAAAVAPRQRRRPMREVPQTAAAGDGDIDAGSEPRQRLRPHRLIIVFVVLLVLLAAGALATFLYVRSQYYVGVANGSPPTVAIYRGVQGSALGVDLSRLATRTDIPLQSLPEYQRGQVSDGIEANGKSDATRIVANLRSAACPSASPSPSASPTPRPTLTPSRTPTHKHRRAHPKPAPSPTPSPPPSYCVTTP